LLNTKSLDNSIQYQEAPHATFAAETTLFSVRIHVAGDATI